MTLPTSGALSLNDIQTEFGGSNPIGLNEYYAGGTYVPSGTSGTHGAVPTSGAISIYNFYGTAKVTIVVNSGTWANGFPWSTTCCICCVPTTYDYLADAFYSTAINSNSYIMGTPQGIGLNGSGGNGAYGTFIYNASNVIQASTSYYSGGFTSNYGTPSTSVADTSGNFIDVSSWLSGGCQRPVITKFSQSGTRISSYAMNSTYGNGGYSPSNGVAINSSNILHFPEMQSFSGVYGGVPILTIGKFNVSTNSLSSYIGYMVSGSAGPAGIGALNSGIALDSSGNGYLSFRDNTNGNYGVYAYAIMKVNSSGVVQWCKGGTNFGVYTSKPAVDSSGNMYVSVWNNALSSYGILKLDTNGNVVWYKRFGATYAQNNIVIGTSGNLYITTSDSTNFYAMVMKINQSGSIIWQKLFTSNYGNNAGFTDIAISPDEAFYTVAGGYTGTSNYNSGAPNYENSYVGAMFKLPADGSKTGSTTISMGYMGNYIGTISAGTETPVDITPPTFTSRSVTTYSPSVSFSSLGLTATTISSGYIRSYSAL